MKSDVDIQYAYNFLRATEQDPPTIPGKRVCASRACYVFMCLGEALSQRTDGRRPFSRPAASTSPCTELVAPQPAPSTVVCKLTSSAFLPPHPQPWDGISVPGERSPSSSLRPQAGPLGPQPALTLRSPGLRQLCRSPWPRHRQRTGVAASPSPHPPRPRPQARLLL